MIEALQANSTTIQYLIPLVGVALFGVISAIIQAFSDNGAASVQRAKNPNRF